MKLNNIRRMSVFGAIGLTTLLTGCASALNVGESEYGCTGLPEGVQCMSAREVYGLTEQPGPVRADPKAMDEDGGASDRAAKAALLSRSGKNTEQASVSNEWSHPDVKNPHPMASAQLNQDPMPIRTRAKIMRIWVAPWENVNGDLHVSGMVFTELDQRRWNIGTKQHVEAPTLTPLQSRQAPQSTKSNRGGRTGLPQNMN
jgi:conjugal transfer pilus assembly protein TraV